MNTYHDSRSSAVALRIRDLRPEVLEPHLRLGTLKPNLNGNPVMHYILIIW